MTSEEYKLFQQLRQEVAAEVKRQLEIDSYCKSYEGAWELTVCYPNYFDDNTGTAPADFFQITLHCYVIGPSRHYTWSGTSWGEALKKCADDVFEWTRGQQHEGSE